MGDGARGYDDVDDVLHPVTAVVVVVVDGEEDGGDGRREIGDGLARLVTKNLMTLHYHHSHQHCYSYCHHDHRCHWSR